LDQFLVIVRDRSPGRGNRSATTGSGRRARL